jgi:hypothetical protein
MRTSASACIKRGTFWMVPKGPRFHACFRFRLAGFDLFQMVSGSLDPPKMRQISKMPISSFGFPASLVQRANQTGSHPNGPDSSQILKIEITTYFRESIQYLLASCSAPCFCIAGRSMRLCKPTSNSSSSIWTPKPTFIHSSSRFS